MYDYCQLASCGLLASIEIFLGSKKQAGVLQHPYVPTLCIIYAGGLSVLHGPLYIEI